MAGGRLTLQERRSIAEGMADGLGYAEIGRRLGRPTSTISREVARNGYSLYSAVAAHDAARHRERPTAAQAAAASESSSAHPTEARAFVEEFAGLLAATGMPRMASRVFTGLLLSETGSLTAADLVRRLQVSPAAVSKAVGYLEGLGLLRREADPGSRRERYVIDDDVWSRALRTDSSAHAGVARGASRGVAIFGAETPAGLRLGLMGRFFGELTEQIDGIDLTDPAVTDAMTVLAALVHGARAVTVDELAVALGWTWIRATAALAELEGRPALADPLVLKMEGGRCSVEARPDRLSPAQRTALRAP
ncbi:MarR family transcriptional regulator [Agromyces sp. NPDC056523]|uniref:GbsR/MarR family transcriptional regulator n=1 Tax=Agromyces sp. NPDC056523 TaxID=3345850 RepID=UPI00366BBEF6